LPALLSFPHAALINEGLAELPNVAPAKVAGASLKNRIERAPQTALDCLGGPQTARNSPSNIEVV
jgi:hypothetical protein